MDPLRSSVPTFPGFLQYLLEEVQCDSTLKMYVPHGTVGSHMLVSSFLLGGGLETVFSPSEDSPSNAGPRHSSTEDHVRPRS